MTGRVAFPALLGYYCADEKLKILVGGDAFADWVCLGTGYRVAWACSGADERDFFRYFGQFSR